MSLHVIEQMKSFTFLRIYSLLTSLTLCLSVLFSLFGTIGNIGIQTIASTTIILGTILELFQILIIIQFTNKNDKVGWILHRFAYVALFVMILAFLSIVGGVFLTSFFVFGRDVMIIAVMGYMVQASFGICLSSIAYHFLKIREIWQGLE